MIFKVTDNQYGRLS